MLTHHLPHTQLAMTSDITTNLKQVLMTNHDEFFFAYIITNKMCFELSHMLKKTVKLNWKSIKKLIFIKNL